MRPADIRIGALAIGTVLLLTAAFAPRLLRGFGRTRNAVWVRVGAAVAGAALLSWGLSSWLLPRATAPPATAGVPILRVSPVDLVDTASIALQDCTRGVPPSIPDGARATGAEMTAARAAFQAYDPATNAYVHCVDQAIERVRSQYAAVASSAELKSLTTFGAGAHDTAIDQEQAVADQFNAQVRAYRAKHAKS
jgi:hypothetical protein